MPEIIREPYNKVLEEIAFVRRRGSAFFQPSQAGFALRFICNVQRGWVPYFVAEYGAWKNTPPRLISVVGLPASLLSSGGIDRTVLDMQNDNSELQTCHWRDDIDSLIFYPPRHEGFCAVHRRAFRTLLGDAPTIEDCVAYFNTNYAAFQIAASEKILRNVIAMASSLHINSRDVKRQLSVAGHLLPVNQ
jgi:hypothetical protein